MFSLNTQYIIHHLLTHIVRRLLPGLFFTLLLIPATAQEIPDTTRQSFPSVTDTTISQKDSLVVDTLAAAKPGKKKTDLEAEVKYSSDDSMSISVTGQKVYLYNKAVVNYQNIGLKADYIEFNLIDHTVSANGVPDSSGQLAGKPAFNQGGEEFDSDTMKYNFDSHKGIIKYIITKQGDGYLHSDRTKRLADGEIHVAKGKYTTCDAPHPHFYIRLTKAIVIPDKKIVSGPAYMVLEDIPLPLAIPFGFFPSTSKRSSGLIIPVYGEEQNRGFYLRDGGWYFVLGEHADLTLQGSLYSRGTWGVKATSVYRKRYKYTGNFNINYTKNKVIDDPSDLPSTDFKIAWSHQQDPKANPNRKFSASVNLSSSSYEKRQSYNVNDVLTNTKSSRISYYRQWGSQFNLTANLQESQNSKSHDISLNLPTVAFNMNRIYPFRGKNSDGRKWLDKVQISYAAKLDNRVKTKDSTFFTRSTLDRLENGFTHSIPISMQGIKLFKIINITPTLSYTGMLYSTYSHERGSPDTAIFLNSKLVVDTLRKVTYAQSLSTSLGISVSPKIYGMYMSKKPNSHIIAVRHVMTPTAAISFLPDMSAIMPNYYNKFTYPNSISKPSVTREYSIYEHNIYGTPTVNGRSGSVSFGLNNTLEMKVRAKTDTSVEEKKVSLLDNFNFTSSYNPFATSFKWSPVNMTGSTKIFNKQLDVRFGATFDPYALDTNGIRVDKYLINENHKLFRTTRGYLDLGFNLKSKSGDKGAEKTETSPDTYTDENNPTLDLLQESTAYGTGAYVNFDIPWSLNVDYSWGFTVQKFEKVYTHTIRLSGDISLTPKWKIGMNTGYDFVTKIVTLTNISIHRDLHCWEMQFSVVPFGQYRNYSFTINAKSTLLRDVKYNKTKSWQDNF